MTTNTRHRPFAAGWDALVGVARNAAARRSERRIRKGAAAIASISDHTLRDIGLTRDDVERMIARSRSGDGF